MGIVHKPSPDWASFIPVLIKALELTDSGMGAENPVLELGMGIFSTPLLHALCRRRLLVSLDNDKRFVDMFHRFSDRDHSLQLVEDWRDHPMVTIEPWTVVLVDQKPAEARKESIKLLTDTDYVVIHDSNDPIYDYESIYPLFKYRFTHEYLQHTTVLSNKHDVKDFLHYPVA